jgi:hypothetical protein
LSDLSCVDINWKMLTIARPETKMEEAFYTKYLWILFSLSYSHFYILRLVELDRLRIATLKMEGEELARHGGKDPDIDVKNPSKSLGGVVVKTIQVTK